MPSVYDWYPTRFISAHDLRGRAHTVQIEKWVEEDVYNRETRETEKLPVLYFAGKHKGMLLRKTNARKIARLYGPDPDGWLGKWITIFPASGQLGDEVRVETRAPTPPPARARRDEAPQPPAADNAGEHA